jgi:molybdenum cofactor guanylyltransferase
MEPVAGVVLTGGLSRRMGGGDKAFREIAGKSLIQHVIERLSPQCSPLAINANGGPGRFAAFALPVIADAADDFQGPLAGILAGLRWAARAAPEVRFIATAACDTPFLPRDLVAKLLAAASPAFPAIALAKSGGRIHPVCGLWPLAFADDLEQALASGTRKAGLWAGRHRHFTVDFPLVPLASGHADPFFNVNTPEDLGQAALLARNPGENPSQ